ncbi:hypothetical protein [Burkholderia sp. S171]|uniref:hypothetical protein n=1 Tax=Burkholderia sp. S171 TaxID=1641860 RepID=UPI0020B1118C|nr:hypothetical protein [Burkholderia sp. S171]
MINRLWAFTFFIAVASDVMAGAFRYYASVVGATPIFYAPKVLMLICIVVLLVQQPPRIGHLLAGLYIAVQACVSLANGVQLTAIFFWLWLVSPMLFAMLAPPGALAVLNGRTARIAFVILAVICMVGVYVNYFMPLPWVGTKADVGGVDIGNAQQSYTGFVKRLPGFGRSSAATGLLIGLMMTWLLSRVRSRILLLVLLVASAVAIWETTNKTTVVALALVVALYSFARAPTLRKACIWVAALMIFIPFASYIATSAVNDLVVGSGALSSFQDRIVETWPNILAGMLREKLIWLGIGPGGFGAAAGYYKGSFGFNVGYADNLALYAVANFGLFGGILLAFLLTKFVLLRTSEDKGLWVMLFFLLLSGITTDVVESLGCLLFLGVTIRSLLGTQASQVLPARSFNRARYSENWRNRGTFPADRAARRAWSPTVAQTKTDASE